MLTTTGFLVQVAAWLIVAEPPPEATVLMVANGAMQPFIGAVAGDALRAVDAEYPLMGWFTSVVLAPNFCPLTQVIVLLPLVTLADIVRPAPWCHWASG
jgi:hypothetical protein